MEYPFQIFREEIKTLQARADSGGTATRKTRS
jgi:hypothetical protein